MKTLPLIALVLLACADPVEQRVRVTKEDLLKGIEVSAPVRIHTFSGSVYLAVEGFTVRNDTISCSGQEYGPTRSLEDKSSWRIPVDSVVGIEYFVVKTPPLRSVGNLLSGTTATIYTAFGGLVLYKALFGSCPTFYTFDGEQPILEAEGFSYSIGKYFEGSDLDRLQMQTPPDGRVRLAVRNEALETHYINQVELCYVDHPAGTEAYPDADGESAHIMKPKAPVRAVSLNGREILGSILGRDAEAYESDDNTTSDLLPRGKRDYVECEFENSSGSSAMTIVLRGRNTLQNTVLLYDVMMRNQGPLVTEWVRKVNENPLYSWRLYRWYREHSGIRVFVERDGQFVEAGRIPDTGPIAWKETAVQVPVDPGSRRVRLRFSFLPESWAIDWIGYDEQAFEASGFAHLSPVAATNNRGMENKENVQSLQGDDDDYLVTGPGTAVELSFVVPTHVEGMRTLFVRSKGYYIEWIRGEWLKARDDLIVFDISNPGKISKDLADLWHQKRAAIKEDFYAHKIPLVP